MKKIFILLITSLVFSCSSKEEFIDDNEENTSTETDVKLSENYIPISDDNINMLDFNLEQEMLVIDIKKGGEKLEPGKIISFEFNGNTYLRKINEVVSEKPYNIKTSHADLGDVFIDGEFTLSSEMGSTRVGNDKNVFYPEFIVYENGDTLRPSRSYTEISNRFIEKSYDLTELNEKYGFDFFQIDDGEIYANLDFRLKFNFRTKEEGEEVIRGNLLDITTSLIGSLGFNYNATYGLEGEFEYSDKEKVDKKNLLKPTKITFNVNGVIIPVWVSVDLMHDFEVKSTGDVSCSYGASYEMQNEIGVNYKQSNNQFTPYMERREIVEVYPPNISASANLSFKYSVFPRFYFYVYDLLGPVMDVKTYLSGDIAASAIITPEYNKQALNFNASSGVDMASKISGKFFSMNYDIFEMPTVGLFNMGLYNSPYKIEIDKVDKENNAISYKVYDTIPFLKKAIPTPMKTPVLLHSDNNNFYETKYASDGIVIADLSKDMQCMTASIFKADGETIDNATYGLCDAVDLGLSVLWCSHNYGVSKPEEFGDYYTHPEAENIQKGDKVGWRLPTLSELDELCEKCKCEDRTLNGVIGNNFIGSNGNSIFMPRMGYYEYDELIGFSSPYVEEKWYLGRYWGYDYSSTNDENENYYESLELGDGGECSTTDKKGIYRMPIRMVIDKDKVGYIF